MSKPLNVSIISPRQIIYEGQALSVSFRAESGYMEVLADHAATVANLLPGMIQVRLTRSEKKTFPLEAKGFAEVNHNNVTLLLSDPIADGS